MKHLKFNSRSAIFNSCVGLFIAIAGMIVISSCGGYSSVSEQEAYDAGYTIGRIISGN